MKKRGQVTTFIIVGIVAVIAIALVYFLRSQVGLFVPTQNYLEGVSENIQANMADCVDKYSKDGLRLMMEQGGRINPTSYRLYQNKKVSYLCSDIPKDERCMNKLDSLNSWAQDFDNYMKLNLAQCIDLESFRNNLGGYEIKDEGYEISTKMLDENVVVEIKPKISLIKEESTINVGNIFRNYDIPLGKIHEIVFDAVNAHATSGSFYNLPYTLSLRGKYEIFIEDKPYPDIIYYVQKKDSEDKFYFAIEGGE